VLRAHLGGAGLGAWLLHELAPAGVDPLGAEAPLAFVFSPLVGTPLTTSAKFAVVAKSPLTGMLTDALASSHFAIAGKLTGHDAIVLVGAAAAPTTVVVDGGGVRLLDAGEQWGQTAAEAEAAVRDRLGGGWQVASIGTAGERGVRFATISHDGRHAGRGGLGAVMGPSGSRRWPCGRSPRWPRPTRPGCWLRPRTCASARRGGPPRSTGSWAPSPTCWPSTP
jgi:aldehyde:ferredoxin oxidoreductase